MTPVLEREEYVEQAYLFQGLRERIAQNVPAQEVLERIHEEILSITRLPMAIQFLATELKHTGLLSSGFRRLQHYFTPFQAYVIEQTENEAKRFGIDMGLLILEREATYRANNVSPPGLFVYQFEALSRNRLGYDGGLAAMGGDGVYDSNWRGFFEMMRQQIGVVDFGEMLYLRSEFYLKDQRRENPAYEPPVAALFGEKEGKIARANLGRDPLYLFSALQRQLGYPEVPRPKPRDDLSAKMDTLQARFRELEARVRLIDAELKGQVDLTKLLSKPELLGGPAASDDI